MQTLVIFEGADRLGKSQTRKHLNKILQANNKLTAKVHHDFISPKAFFTNFAFSMENDKFFAEKTFEYMAMELYGMKALEQRVPGNENLFILADRMHMSEAIYGPLNRPHLVQEYFGSDFQFRKAFHAFEDYINTMFRVVVVAFIAPDDYDFVDDEANPFGKTHTARELQNINYHFSHLLLASKLPNIIEITADKSADLEKVAETIYHRIA